MLFLRAYRRCAQRGRMPSMATFKKRGFYPYGNDWEEPFDESKFDRGLSLHSVRSRAIGLCGFALLAQEQVEVLRDLQPLVEIGAGLGFWTFALRNAGIDIVATDLKADEYGSRGFEHVEAVEASDAVRKYSDRNVLSVWPSLGADLSADAVAAMAPGRRLALAHEGQDGCVGSDTLFETLGRDFTEEIEHPLACWPCIHDRLGVFVRRGEFA